MFFGRIRIKKHESWSCVTCLALFCANTLLWVYMFMWDKPEVFTQVLYRRENEPVMSCAFLCSLTVARPINVNILVKRCLA